MLKITKSVTDNFSQLQWATAAPAHKAKATQRCLKENVSDFIEHKDWLSTRRDLNTFDYKLWSVLEVEGCQRKYSYLYSFKVLEGEQSNGNSHEGSVNFDKEVAKETLKPV
ncbi:hypothetical protein TNCV_946931 [Trichonephila clavipes]|nr:hypothetical protein TNCV_946931 [Trichonephila clavipes]